MPENEKPQRSLVKKLCRIMAAVDHIEKKGRNLSQGYDFAREADITRAIRAEFAKENVFMLPDVVEATYAAGATAKGNPKRLCTLKVRFTFEDGDSGEVRSFHGMGEAEDTGDKSSNKAITAAVKYGILKAFLIPTGDDTENDQKPEPVRQRPAPAKVETATLPGPTPEDLKKVAESFAPLGVTVADLDAFLGWPLSTASAGDMARLRKHLAATRAARAKPADPAEAVKAQAEAAFVSAQKSLAPKKFEDFITSIRAATKPEEIIILQAQAVDAKLTPGDLKALNRTAGEFVSILKQRAHSAASPTQGDVPF